MSKKNKPSRRQMFWEKHYSPRTKPYLLHYLSPLETAVLNNRLQKFNYNFDGVITVIDENLCDAIYQASRVHTRHLRDLIRLTRLKQMQRDPVKRKFLTMPLNDHDLPKRLFNALHFRGCNNMAAVAEKGTYQLRQIPGIGNESIDLLKVIFEANDCGLLFIDNA